MVRANLMVAPILVGLALSAGCKKSEPSSSAPSATASAAPAPERKDRFPSTWRMAYFRGYRPADPQGKESYQRREQWNKLELASNTIEVSSSNGHSFQLEVSVSCEDSVCSFTGEGHGRPSGPPVG
jgi:hypothetical protein